MKLTPVLLVESVEESVAFWVERMGWQKAVDVPDGDVIGFAILTNEDSELMLQIFASAEKDGPQFVAGSGRHRSSLFIEVGDWANTIERLEGFEVAMPERTTFYGMREIGVFQPGGPVVIFAKPE